MKKKLVLLGAALALFLAVSATSVANEVYFSQETVYIPECGNATVDILMNATNYTDTWSTMIKFDSVCVSITEVNFSGSITPTNASWGDHDSYIYLGGTNLTATSDNELLLATLTVECNGSSCGPVALNFTGEEEVERLMAGPPDDAPPRNGTIYSTTWTNGSAQCVGCGDVDGNGIPDILDGKKVAKGEISTINWAADVDCDGIPDILDGKKIAKGELNCCYS
ncbi:hypothetical protein C5S31_04970 [ANME-1 cluster archaeon GoMg2]|nr:hypothetical protein [ANME-1 cluster archaeon GoMg2]